MDKFSDEQETITTLIEHINTEGINTIDVDALFRHIHTINTQLRTIGLERLANLANQVELLLDDIRQTKIEKISTFIEGGFDLPLEGAI